MTEYRIATPNREDIPNPDGVRRSRPPRPRLVPVPSAPATVPLTDEEIKALEAERDMLVAAGRAGAFRPISKSQQPTAEVVILDPAPEQAGKPAVDGRGAPAVVISRLKEIGDVPAQREREYTARVRAELEPLAKEAEELFKEYQALRDEISPTLSGYLSLDWHLIGRTMSAAVGRSGGNTACESLRHKIESLAGALSTNGGSDNPLGQAARRLRTLSLSDIRGDVIGEVKRTITTLRGGPAQLRVNFQVIQRLMAAMSEALVGLRVPTKPLEGTRNPWAADTDPRPSRRTITDFNPLEER